MPRYQTAFLNWSLVLKKLGAFSEDFNTLAKLVEEIGMQENPKLFTVETPIEGKNQVRTAKLKKIIKNEIVLPRKKKHRFAYKLGNTQFCELCRNQVKGLWSLCRDCGFATHTSCPIAAEQNCNSQLIIAAQAAQLGTENQQKV